ncbi:SURF1 family protein [Leisingera sp. HS039]|uniref:SURF1 family protein n=1 Tax=unclassified Leisingera TaxID=2614906 RepID=UPI001070E23C|nr:MULTISPECIES: SURF1 family protein [unclassified Leisingera]MBQ4824084.1 SURF1 family protein [Leisingera sp. HS039]QBR35543.1 SURF1 family protein [Leisingera sp. NJS201]
MRHVGFLVVVSGLGIAILLGLGTWQLQRLAWKEQVIEDIIFRLAGLPESLPASPDAAEHKYQAVDLFGTISGAELHVLVSSKETGTGFRIIQALTEDKTGRRILLERGFVPEAAKNAERSTGPVYVAGNLHWPVERDSFTPKNDPDNNFWYARDLAEMAAALKTEPVLVISREPLGENVRPMGISTSTIPNNHLQYAITWFSLAFIWAAMTVYFLRRNRANS